MTIELVKILEEAKRYHDKSNQFFDYYTIGNQNSDWETSREYDMVARGLLRAYAIMTGKQIYPHEIEEELKLC